MANPSKYTTSENYSSSDSWTERYTAVVETVTSPSQTYKTNKYKDTKQWAGVRFAFPKALSYSGTKVGLIGGLAKSGYGLASYCSPTDKDFKGTADTETFLLRTKIPDSEPVVDTGNNTAIYSHTVYKAFRIGCADGTYRTVGYRNEFNGDTAYWGVNGDYYYITYWCLLLNSDPNTQFPTDSIPAPYLDCTLSGTYTATRTETYELVSDSAISCYLGSALANSSLNGLRIMRRVTAVNQKVTDSDGNILRTSDDSDTTSTYLTCSASSLKNGATPNSSAWVLEVEDSANGRTFGFEGNYTVYAPRSNWMDSLALEQTTFVVGQAFDVDGAINYLKTRGRVHYTDGTYRSLNSVSKSCTGTLYYTEDGVEKSISSGTLTLEKLKEYSNAHFDVQITMNWNETNTGSPVVFNKSFPLTFTSTLAQSVTISGVKTDFVCGEAYSYGDDAIATIAYTDGTSENMTIEKAETSGFLIRDSKVTSGTLIPSGQDTDTLTTIPLAEDGNSIINTIYISYVDDFQLENTYLGSVYVNADTETDVSAILEKVGTAKATYHNNTASLQNEVTETFEYGTSLTPSFTKNTWSVDSTANRVTFSATSSHMGQTFSAVATFDVYIIKPSALSVSHEAELVYFENRTNKFHKPTNLVIKKVYNNGDEASLSSAEQASIVYRGANDATSDALAEGSTLPSAIRTIYVFVTTDEGSTISGSYSIGGDFQADTISSVVFGKSISFTLGNRMSKYASDGAVTIHATYASGYEEDLASDTYSFVSSDFGDDPIVTASGATFYIAIDGVKYQVGYADGVSVSYSVPLASISFTPPSETYVNTSDKVDFTGATAKVAYEGADASMGATISFDEGNEATKTTYKVSSNEASLTAFNGSQAFNLTDAGTSVTRTFTITTLNRFDGSSVAYTYSVKVLSVTSLNFEKIEVLNPKLEYKVGETFLNETDTTKITLSCDAAELTLNLRDAGSIVSVNPSKGLTFTRTDDSKQIDIVYSKNKDVSASYTLSVVASTSASVGKTSTIRAVLMGNSTSNPEPFNVYHAYYSTEEATQSDIVCEGYYVLVDEANTTYSNGARALASGKKWSDVKIYGYLEDAFIKTCSARVILLEDHIPLVQSESNITVTFPCYVEGNSDLIDKCHIAKLFGNNNAKNRLFVSGNPDKANYDWHSNEVNSYVQTGETVDPNGDFTYFGDTSYCAYGQSDNRVLGYDNVATDKMVVLLSKSKIEPTNYFRGSGLGTAIDGGGNTVYDVSGTALSDEQFPCYTGNIGAGAMNEKSVINLNGDTLYLSSENTVCGLDISGQVGDSQRISYSRSKYIDPELKGLDLSDAVLWTNNVIALLLTGDGAYMTNYETYSSETGQYEWWKTDVKGARCAIEADDVIYFGCEDGSLLKVDSSIFYDCDKVFIPEGGVIYGADTSYGEGKITYSERLNPEIDESGTYVFTMRPDSLKSTIYRRVGLADNSKRAGVDLYIDFATNTLRLVALDKDSKFDAERYAVMLDELADEASWFYLNGPEGTNKIIGDDAFGYTEHYKRYQIRACEDYEDAYRMYDSSGLEVKLARSVTSSDGKTTYVYNLQSFDLCKALDGQYEVCDLDKASCTFKLRRHGRAVNVLLYGDQSTGSYSYSSELHKHTPIKTYFVCSPATLSGGVSYRKTLWAYTLTAFKEANDLEMCLATNEDNLEAMRSLAFADSVPVGFDLNDLSFSKVDFGKDNVPRKYTYFRPVSVPFACFGFRSEKAANSVLTTAQIVYSVPMMGRGNK